MAARQKADTNHVPETEPNVTPPRDETTGAEDVQFLKWLAPLDYRGQQRDFHRRQQEGTGVWFLNSKHYETWLDEQKHTLWCYGPPGSGKTTLASMVINDVCNKFRNETSLGVAYIYCNFRHTEQQKIDDLLANVLRQLVDTKTPLPECVKTLFIQNNTKKTRPTRSQISGALFEVSLLYGRVFVIIDALDECQLADGDLHELLTEISSLQRHANVSTLVTSRSILQTQDQLSNPMEMEIRAPEGDIRLYLRNHMNQLPSFVTSSPNLQEEIQSKIIAAAGGVCVIKIKLQFGDANIDRFLLARLYLDSLKSKMTIKETRAIINGLTTETNIYEHAYTNAMDQIREQVSSHRRLAKKVIMWATFAKRPLTTTEMQHIIAVEEEQNRLDEDNIQSIESLISVCAGLVTVDEECDIIRLVHPTAQEYFKRMKERWFSKAHLKIARACVTYLSIDSFETGCCATQDEFENRLRCFPFYDYAANYWAAHADVHPLETRDLVLGFLRSGAKLVAAEQAAMASADHATYSQTVPPNARGHETVARLLLQGDANVKGSDATGATLLHHAASNGDETTVKLLLEGGAVCDAVNGHHDTPLCEAARNGHEKVARLLLSHGARANWKGSREENMTPLMLTALEGHGNVARALLENGAKVDGNLDPESHSWTPLALAAICGHESVARVLIENGAEIDGDFDQSKFSWTPLLLAAQNGHEAVVRLLVEKGGKIKIGGKYQGAPLSIASIADLATITQMLQGGGAIVEEPATKRKKKAKISDEGETPLITAAKNGHGAIVRLLIEKGAYGDGKSRYIHCTDSTVSFGWAVLNGYIPMARLLLENGADVNWEVEQGNDSQTVLFVAARNGHTAIVKLLVEKGANLELGQRQIGTKHWRETPLFIASLHGHDDVVMVLLMNGADVNVKMKFASDVSYKGQTPLIAAAEKGHENVVRMLIDKEAVIEARTLFFETNALLAAAENGHAAIVWKLIEKGANIEATSKGIDGTNGMTPLLHAAKSGHEDVVRLLLEVPKKKANIEVKCDGHGATALIWAAMNGREAVVRVLLEDPESRANLEAKCDSHGGTPLLWAARNGHTAIAQLLIEHGAVVETKTKYKHMTPLLEAAKGGQPDVVKVLLDNGADVAAKDSIKRMTALSWAAKGGHEAVGELLRERESRSVATPVAIPVSTPVAAPSPAPASAPRRSWLRLPRRSATADEN